MHYPDVFQGYIRIDRNRSRNFTMRVRYGGIKNPKNYEKPVIKCLDSCLDSGEGFIPLRSFYDFAIRMVVQVVSD